MQTRAVTTSLAEETTKNHEMTEIKNRKIRENVIVKNENMLTTTTYRETFQSKR